MVYKASNLMRLDIVGIHIYPQTYKIVAKAIKNTDSLISINFSGTKLGNAGVAGKHLESNDN